MSSYDNVVGGKLKLKGKALDVKVGGVKKKKKLKKNEDQISRELENEHPAGLFNYYWNCLTWISVNVYLWITLLYLWEKSEIKTSRFEQHSS